MRSGHAGRMDRAGFGFGLMVLCVLLTAVSGAEIRWPDHWVVFGPVTREATMPRARELAAIPEHLTIDGEVLEPALLPCPDGVADLSVLHGDPEAGRTALVFVPFSVAEAGVFTLGFGADWWFEAFLDGERIADSLATGNTVWPPNVSNFRVPVSLEAGAHVLAIRFISGQGSSRLAVGGPAQIAAVPPSQWSPVATSGAELGPETVVNGTFEAGVDARGVPTGWLPGPVGKRFAEGELSLRPHADGGGVSLEINTLGSAPDRVAKLACPIRIQVDMLYQVACTGTYLEGHWLALSIQADPDCGNSNFLHVLGDTTVPNAANVPGKRHSYRGNVFIDQREAYLVLTARGGVRARIDTLSVRAHPDHAKRFVGFKQQRIPWPAGHWDTIEGPEPRPNAPYTPWGSVVSPGRGGTPARLLSVLPRWSQLRAVELAKRFECRATPVMTAGPNEVGNDYWIRGADGELDILRVEADARLKFADEPDAIYLGLMSPSTPPDWMLAEIFDRVEAGAGLVVTGEWQPFYPYPDADKNQPRDTYRDSTLDAFESGRWQRGLSAANRIEAPFSLPGPLGSEADVRFYRCGRGRIVFLRSLPVLDAPSTSRAEFEAIACLTGLALKWAAEGAAFHLAGLVARDQDPTWNLDMSHADPRSAVALRLSTPLVSETLLRWHVLERGAFSDTTHGEQTLDAGARTVSLRLPYLPAGIHWIGMQLMRPDGAARAFEWQLARLNVTGDITISSLHLAVNRPLFHTAGTPLTGHVALSRPLETDEQVRVILRDAQGWTWQTVTLDGPGPRVPFALATEGRRVLLHEVVADVCRNDTVLATASAEICIAETPAETMTDFDYQLWQMPGDGYIAEVANRLFSEHGITSSILRTASRNLAAANVRALGITGMNYPSGRGRITGDEAEAPVRAPCLTGPTYRKRCAERITLELDRGEPWAPRAHLLGHEQNIAGVGARLKGDYCFSSTCLAHFRQMMQREYSDLAALNRSWGTRIESWDQVRPITLDGAVLQNQPARWIDHRRHMDLVWTEWSQFKIETVRERIPGAEAVFDNFHGDDSFSGVDYWLLLNRVVSGSALPADMLRSFVPPARRHLNLMRSAAWHPEAVTENAELLRGRFGMAPWVALLEGMRGYGYWSHVFGGVPDSVFAQPVTPDLRTTLAGQLPNRAVARIRGGIHRLFFDAERNDCGIAILYSRSSEHASHIWQVIQRTSQEAQTLSAQSARNAFVDAFDRHHLAFSTLSEAQLADGVLTYPRYRVIVLPLIQALHPQAAVAVRRFVAQGGTVLADLRPGVCDHHGAAGDSGLLDEVFGIRQNPELAAFRPVWERPLVTSAVGGADAGVSLERTLCGPALTPAGAVAGGAAGERPVWLSHRFGEGSALLLNTALPPRGWRTAGLLTETLAAAGVLPPAELVSLARSSEIDEPIDSGPRPALQRGAFADGEGFGLKTLFDQTAPARLVHWRAGALDLFGVWSFRRQRGLGTEELLLRLPRAGWVYELTGNWESGGMDVPVWPQCSDVRFTMALEDVRIFAVLPYAVPGLSVRADAAQRLDGLPAIHYEVRLQGDDASQQRHPLQIALLPPDGAENLDPRAVVVAEDNRATGTVILPLEAPRGAWRLTVRDAISGSTAAAVVDVE